MCVSACSVAPVWGLFAVRRTWCVVWCCHSVWLARLEFLPVSQFLRRIMQVLPVVVFVLLLAACGSARPAAPASVEVPEAIPSPTPTAVLTVDDSVRVLTDSAGREVKVPGIVARLVSLAPSATEILYAIGAGEWLVGVDDFSNFPDATKDLERLGSFTPDLERIVAMEPDLVVAAQIISPEIIEQLTNVGVSVWIADSPDVQGVAESIRRLGVAVRRESTAEAVATELEGRLADLAALLAERGDRPRVFHELDASDPMRPFTVGPGNFVHDLLALAGADNVFGDASTPFPQVSFEEVLARDPQVIILADGPFGVTAASVGERTGWDVLSAVRDGRILEVSPELGDIISRPGPRIADGLEVLARFIHPDAFLK
jgi:iron complex transport system substrate-binding protein